MYLNYSLTEDFTLIQITFGNLKAIDLRLKQGKFYCVTLKQSEILLENETEYADFK